MKLLPFAVSIIATKEKPKGLFETERTIKTYGVAVLAYNKFEAEGRALRFLKEKCPVSDGWSNYMIDAVEFTQDQIERIGKDE